MTELDIFIPYWGDPGYMVETVRSVLAQDSDAWQLTIVDDAYPSLEVRDFVAGLASDRIRYVRKDANEGITENYRTCVGMAESPVMMMLGSDDRLLPNYVREVLAAHERFPDAAIIQPRVEVIDDAGHVVHTLADAVKQHIVQPRGSGTQVLAGEPLATSLLHGDWLYWPALTFRTDKIQATPFRDGFPLIQDLAVVLDMVFRGDSMVLTPHTAFQYRRHSASASSSTLVDGTRFEGERRYFALAADTAGALGWKAAERAARLRLTSRLHSVAVLPAAIRKRDAAAVRSLTHHAFGSWKGTP